MIKKLTNLSECDKIIKTYLEKTSNLAPTSVLNSLSPRGVDLHKLIPNTKVYESYKLSDNCILFETYNRDSNKNVVLEPSRDGAINIVTSLTTKVLIYGNTSNQLGHIIQGKLSSEYYINQLYNEGIMIDSISNVESSNEFINNTLWLRHYFTINYSVELYLTNNDVYEDYEIINIKNIIKN